MFLGFVLADHFHAAYEGPELQLIFGAWAYFGAGNDIYEVPFCAVPGEVFGEGGGANCGGAVRALPVGEVPNLCFKNIVVRPALYHITGATQFGVSCCSLFVVLWEKGRVGGGSVGGDVRGEVHGVHG